MDPPEVGNPRVQGLRLLLIFNETSRNLKGVALGLGDIHPYWLARPPVLTCNSLHNVSFHLVVSDGGIDVLKRICWLAVPSSVKCALKTTGLCVPRYFFFRACTALCPVTTGSALLFPDDLVCDSTVPL
mmetsp:Transcript_93051/g.221257  ORF Transcript_93051/g.221257 Transcript_93051/m.221257 type:complete len:129 (-) Transcript_93051:1159-1545(-)